MAKKIVIEADASPFKKEFQRTAAEIDSSLDRLGAKTSKLSLGNKQQVDYYKEKLRQEDIPNRRKSSLDSIRESERLKDENRKEFERERNRINRDKSLGPDQKRNMLADARGMLSETNSHLDDDIGKERGKLEEFDRLTGAVSRLSGTIREQEFHTSSRHNEWKKLSNDDLKQKLKDSIKSRDKINKKGGDTEELDGDIDALRREKARRGLDDDKGLADTIRNSVAWHYVGQGIRQVGGAIGNTTGQVADIGVNAVGAGAINPLAGVAAGGFGLLGLLLNKGKQLEDARDSLGGIAGIGRRKDFGNNGFFENLGFDQMEVMGRANSLARTRGTASHLEDEVYSDLIMSKGLGLQEGDLNGINSMARTDKSGLSTHGAVMKLVGTLEKSALVNLSKENFDVSALPKYLEKVVALNQYQFDKTGSSDSRKSIGLLGSATQMGGIWKHEQNASSLIQGIQGAFASPQDDLQRIHNYQAIIEAHPELANDPEALEMMMENPSQAAMRNLLLQTRRRGRAMGGSGKWGNYLVSSQLKQFTGGSMSKARQLRNSNMLAGGAGGDMSESLLMDRALENSGSLNKYEATMSNTFAGKGEDTVKVLDTALQAMSGGKSLSDVVDSVKELTGIMKDERPKRSPDGKVFNKTRTASSSW